MKTTTKSLLAILTLSCSIAYAEDTKPPSKPSLKPNPEKMEEHRKHREEFEKLSPEEKQKKREEFMSNHPEAKAKFEEFKKNHPDWEKKSPEEKRELMRNFKEKKGKKPSPK